MSQTWSCKACNQQSTDADYCSHCGVEITVDSGAAAPTSTPAQAAGINAATPVLALPVIGSAPATAALKHEECPKCGAERDDPTSIFCGTCGYNYVSKQGGDVLPPEVAAKATTTPANTGVNSGAPSPTGALSDTGVSSLMDLVITVDFSKPAAPKVRPALTFPLFDEESLIGRKSATLKQTIAIEDEAISKRHALIVRNSAGDFIIRDLNSTNGTRVNGVDLVAGADQPLKQGDQICIGEYTVITVQAIKASSKSGSQPVSHS